MNRRLGWLATVAVPLVLACFLPAQPAVKGRKFALVVGVGEYRHNWPQLGQAPGNDATEMEKLLKTGDYRVIKLTDRAATQPAIEAAFQQMMNGQERPGDPIKRLETGDQAVVLLCG